jgi:hypothetical protein
MGNSGPDVLCVQEQLSAKHCFPAEDAFATVKLRIQAYLTTSMAPGLEPMQLDNR